MASVVDRLFLAAVNEDVDGVDKAIGDYKTANKNRFNTDDLKDSDKRTIAHYACLSNTENVALHILAKGRCGTGDKHGAYPYMYAARRGFLQFLNDWSKENSSMKATDGSGQNALHYCCGGGADSKSIITEDKGAEKSRLVECVQFLLEKGLDFKQKDKSEKTPLQYCEENQDDDMITELILSKVISETQLSPTLTMLFRCNFRFPEIFATSLDEFIVKNQPEPFDMYKILCKICDLTVRIQSDDDTQGRNGETDQVSYRLTCAESVFNYLQEFVFKPKRSAVRSAISTKFYEMITFLSVKKAKVILDEDQDIYEPILHFFVRTLFEEKSNELVKDKVASLQTLLRKCQLDHNVTDDRGMSPLHQLCGDIYETEPRTFKSLRTFLAERFVELGVDVHKEDTRGRTPLMIAVQAGHMEVIRLLLEVGADPLQVNKWGRTASWFTKDKETLALLKEHQTENFNRPQVKEGQPDNYKSVAPMSSEKKPSDVVHISTPGNMQNKDIYDTSLFVSAMQGLVNKVECLSNKVDHLSNCYTEIVDKLGEK